MLSPIFGRTGVDNATAERFGCLAGTPNSPSPTSIEPNNRNVMADDGTLRNWYLRRITAPGAGTSVTYTIMKNGVATALAITIADTATSGSDVDPDHAVNYVIGDVFSIRITPTGTVATSTLAHCLDNFATGQMLLTGESATATTTSYLGLQASNLMAAATDIQAVIPTDGTIDRAVLDLSAAAGAGKSWTATLVVNGSDTALTVTISGASALQNSDLTHPISVAAGDTAYWRIDATGAPTATRHRIGCRFIPTIPGESIQTFTATNNLGATGNNFSGVGAATLAYSTTENTRVMWLGSAFDIKKLYAVVNTSPGAATWTYTARSNSANTALTCAITGATSNQDITHTVTPTTGAFLGMNTVGTSSPTACPGRWSFVTYRAPTSLPYDGGRRTHRHALLRQ